MAQSFGVGVPATAQWRNVFRTAVARRRNVYLTAGARWRGVGGWDFTNDKIQRLLISIGAISRYDIYEELRACA